MQVHEFRQILISRLGVGVSYDAAVWDDSFHVSVGTIFDKNKLPFDHTSQKSWSPFGK